MLFFSDHDIMSSGHFLPPNTKVQFSLTRSSDQFVILSDKDEEKYKLQILSICLYVPVGVMSTKMTQELMMKWTHTDIQYFYDRLDVKVLSMPSNKQEYLSDALFSEFEHPSRVYIMLVETQAVLGNYKLSPYHFGRKWTVVTTASSLTQINYDNVERLSLITAFEQLRDQVAHLVANNGKKKIQNEEESDSSESESLSEKKKRKRPATRKQSGAKEKQSKKKATEPQASTSAAATAAAAAAAASTSSYWRLFSKYPQVDALQTATDNRSEASASSFEVLDRPGAAGVGDEPGPGPGPKPDPVTTTYWLTKCQLELNSAPLNQVKRKKKEIFYDLYF